MHLRKHAAYLSIVSLSADISSEYCMESPLVHEPSLGRHLNFSSAVDLASVEYEGLPDAPSVEPQPLLIPRGQHNGKPLWKIPRP